jgi:predicted GNAT superfamily acetyltransferase
MDKGRVSLGDLSVHVLPVQDMNEMIVNLQRQVWGYSEIDTVPSHIFVVARETGGQVFGAFCEGRIIGFALAFAGTDGGRVYLHSHMVAVLPEFQNRGVGRCLKLAQRDDAIARGIGLIVWTFDPLQAKNAHFNLGKLGAIVRRYVRNYYGRTSSSLHWGLPTDRLVAEWRIRSSYVEEHLSGKVPARQAATRRISIPEVVDQNSAGVQLLLREQLEAGFGEGFAAVGFEFDGRQGHYLLEPYEG